MAAGEEEEKVEVGTRTSGGEAMKVSDEEGKESRSDEKEVAAWVEVKAKRQRVQTKSEKKKARKVKAKALKRKGQGKVQVVEEKDSEECGAEKGRMTMEEAAGDVPQQRLTDEEVKGIHQLLDSGAMTPGQLMSSLHPSLLVHAHLLLLSREPSISSRLGSPLPLPH